MMALARRESVAAVGLAALSSAAVLLVCALVFDTQDRWADMALPTSKMLVVVTEGMRQTYKWDLPPGQANSLEPVEPVEPSDDFERWVAGRHKLALNMPALTTTAKYDSHLFDGEQVTRMRENEYGESARPPPARGTHAAPHYPCARRRIACVRRSPRARREPAGARRVGPRRHGEAPRPGRLRHRRLLLQSRGPPGLRTADGSRPACARLRGAPDGWDGAHGDPVEPGVHPGAGDSQGAAA
jgi:hypothetical protein